MNLSLVIITSLKVLAVWVVLQDGMIFSRVRKYLFICLPPFLHKPLFDCLTCMGGFWSLIFWLIDWPDCGLFDLMIPVIGLNYLLSLWKDQFFIGYGETDER
jgi:hypothetical protein